MGVENFEQIINDNYYYVDKTKLISELFHNGGIVNLITRPRRFGKTLNMSMLEHFFSIGGDKNIFDGLKISKDKKLCEDYMGKYPVISVSLKGINAAAYEDAFDFAVQIMKNVAGRTQFLLESRNLSDFDKSEYKELLDSRMSKAVFCSGLKILSELLEKHYGTKVILLIDEYDVPLAKAFENGYYDQMVFLIRNLLEQSLKTNNSLKFAVMTGCMRISKESIFTGLNNFTTFTITDVDFDEYFGFTDQEVCDLLTYYECTDKYGSIKEWYDGYRFGNVEVYCPWDVVSYLRSLRTNKEAIPQNYWVNTSSNGIVRKLIEQADEVTRKEIELLVNGRSIKKKLRQELTYRDMDSDIDNLWSILFTTGYLTQCGQDDGGLIELVIPNREIQWIFEEQIWEWMKKDVRKDFQKLENFCKAFEQGDTQAIESGFNSYLRKTISLRDNSVRKDSKENFYHGILLGLFAGMEGWMVRSNAESGEGYSDISIEIEDKDIGIVIELKYAQNAAFDEGCRKALQQIRDRNYEEELLDDGMKIIRRYGIACYKKRCKVVSE